MFPASFGGRCEVEGCQEATNHEHMDVDEPRKFPWDEHNPNFHLEEKMDVDTDSENDNDIMNTSRKIKINLNVTICMGG